MGASAMRADDVWTAGDGQLVEIIHTDAEGRLVMGDAICYAKNNLKDIDDQIKHFHIFFKVTIQAPYHNPNYRRDFYHLTGANDKLLQLY